MRYWVAATSTRRVKQGGLRQVWEERPSGVVHAVDSEDQVVCGTRPEPLHPFPDKDWEGLWDGVFEKCPRCTAAVNAEG